MDMNSEWQQLLEKVRDDYDNKVGAGEINYKDVKPVMICPECGEEGVIKRSFRTITHLSHMAETNFCKKQAEMFLQKEVKRRLCEFLNNGGECRLSHVCTGKYELASLKLKYKVDHKIVLEESDYDEILEVKIPAKTINFDIVGFDEEGNMSICLITKVGNHMQIINDHPEVKFYELDPHQIYKLLTALETPRRIILTRLNMGSCCNPQPVVKSSRQPFKSMKNL